MIAILALSPRGERTRIWLEDTLWGRVDRVQAQGSLRRELASIRSAVGEPVGDLLDIGRDAIRLRLENCTVDALEPADGHAPGTELLEGLDLRDEEGFEDWLRTERQAERQSHARVDQPPKTNGLANSAQLDVLIYLDATSLGASAGGGGPTALVPEMLRQSLAARLTETGFARPMLADGNAPRPTGPSAIPDIELHIRAIAAGDVSWLVILAHRFRDAVVLLSRQEGISVSGGWDQASRRVDTFADQCVDQLLHAVLRDVQLRSEQHQTHKAVFAAIEEMFSLDPAVVRRSRETLSTAVTSDASGVLNAWRAYQAVFLADPAHMYDFRLTLDECRDGIRRAVEAEPFNGLVLSLCTHVEAFLFRDFASAWDLIDRARSTGTRHVMYYDALALLYFYCGKYDDAREAARTALSAGRNLSYRYCFETTLCMVEALAGNYEQAIQHGRRALQLEPSNRKISYPPTVRYLAATLAHAGAREEARALFDQLRILGRPMDRGILGSPEDALPNAEGANFVKHAFELAYN